MNEEAALSRRGIIALILCVILPPVGLFYIWREGLFKPQGRIIVSAVSCVILFLMFLWDPLSLVYKKESVIGIKPVPGMAELVTRAPDDTTLNALYNIDELVAANMTRKSAESGENVTYMTQEQLNAQNEAILDTVVYSVYRNAKYYHKDTVCGHQSNGRALTVREALAEGMGACPDCNPPVPQP